VNDRIGPILDALGSPTIAVAGDVILDRYLWGRVRRISPEAPVPVLEVEHEEFRPGGAANVAANLAALGARAILHGVAGRDPAARTLERIARTRLIRAVRPTTVKTRLVAHNQQILRVDEERRDPLDARTAARLGEAIARTAPRADALILSDYHKGALVPPVVARAFAAFRRKPILVGLKTPQPGPYRGATGAMLNREELAALAPSPRALIRALRLEFLVVTLGPDGILVVPRRGRPARFPTLARQVYDVTGAGDTCLAAFALAYVSGCPLPDCAALANAAAGVVVGKVGTATATRAEIRRHVSPQAAPPRTKILGRAALLRALAEERRRGRRVVFTNGCFDLLHPGHVDLLRAARAQGDVLVVGLNSDHSVRRLKGPARPILPQRARAELLAALEAVDYVTIFGETTPAALIRAVRPDVLVKGADWAGAVVGREEVEKRGGRTVLVPLRPGFSTSAIVEHIRDGAPRR
jgi:D-beta-D-heptose 7-phosphate kinase/D-beta-D-heptose 1-phosphate adenosyltransferase